MQPGWCVFVAGWCQLYLKRIALWFTPAPDKLLLLIEISNPLKPEDAGEKEGVIRARFCMPPYERVQVEQASSRVYKFLTSKNFRLSCGGKSFYADEWQVSLVPTGNQSN